MTTIAMAPVEKKQPTKAEWEMWALALRVSGGGNEGLQHKNAPRGVAVASGAWFVCGYHGEEGVSDDREKRTLVVSILFQLVWNSFLASARCY
ncbi:hypothetical protein Cni_G19424 [Canna indica]|uniref:Uncharacterized protein n=1 Tax=Canna indica TaxID=4628 RepID=A0AAQ3QJQ8_9LILI|nr:hypothetical protein Cni_G19424 [Canna indica]